MGRGADCLTQGKVPGIVFENGNASFADPKESVSFALGPQLSGFRGRPRLRVPFIKQRMVLVGEARSLAFQVLPEPHALLSPPPARLSCRALEGLKECLQPGSSSMTKPCLEGEGGELKPLRQTDKGCAQGPSSGGA